ncbi:MAG: DNA primase [bacterium]|nr:DNA primase [bacterium]
MDTLEQIKSRLSIEELVGQYVHLKKSGRNFKALCPFHNEKSPSFIISPDKGLAYCFGCRKGGDIFAFIQQIENIDFPEAVRTLGEKTGVETQEQGFGGQRKEEKEKILNIISEAQSFFREQLKKTPAAVRYLEERGYDQKLQAQWEFGFAPDSFHLLTEYLKSKSYSPNDILDAGLASQKNVGDSNIYDRFRNRVTFPIQNTQGHLVAFGGRTLSPDPDAAKYLNSPETRSYHKGDTLYCFHRAKQSIRETDRAIIVEGYFDALTAHSKGFPNTVASLGTALTENQVKLLGRLTKNLYFAFDADTSGQSAASRSIEIAQRLGFNASVIIIPSGKDPDDCLRSSPEEWEKAIQSAKKAIDYEFEKAFSKTDKNTLEGKKTIAEELLPIIRRLPNSIEQEHYLKQLALELETSIKSLVSELNRLKNPFSSPNSPKAPNSQNQQPETSNQNPSFSRSECLLGILLSDPKAIDGLDETFRIDFVQSEPEKTLYKSLLDQYNQSDGKNAQLKSENQEIQARLQLLELYTDENYQEFTAEELQQEAINLCNALREEYKKNRLQTLRQQMAKENKPEYISEYQKLLGDQF